MRRSSHKPRQQKGRHAKTQPSLVSRDGSSKLIAGLHQIPNVSTDHMQPPLTFTHRERCVAIENHDVTPLQPLRRRSFALSTHSALSSDSRHECSPLSQSERGRSVSPIRLDIDTDREYTSRHTLTHSPSHNDSHAPPSPCHVAMSGRRKSMITTHQQASGIIAAQHQSTYQDHPNISSIARPSHSARDQQTPVPPLFMFDGHQGPQLSQSHHQISHQLPSSSARSIRHHISSTHLQSLFLSKQLSQHRQFSTRPGGRGNQSDYDGSDTDAYLDSLQSSSGSSHRSKSQRTASTKHPVNRFKKDPTTDLNSEYFHEILPAELRQVQNQSQNDSIDAKHRRSVARYISHMKSKRRELRSEHILVVKKVNRLLKSKIRKLVWYRSKYPGVPLSPAVVKDLLSIDSSIAEAENSLNTLKEQLAQFDLNSQATKVEAFDSMVTIPSPLAAGDQSPQAVTIPKSFPKDARHTYVSRRRGEYLYDPDNPPGTDDLGLSDDGEDILAHERRSIRSIHEVDPVLEYNRRQLYPEYQPGDPGYPDTEIESSRRKGKPITTDDLERIIGGDDDDDDEPITQSDISASDMDETPTDRSASSSRTRLRHQDLNSDFSDVGDLFENVDDDTPDLQPTDNEALYSRGDVSLQTTPGKESPEYDMETEISRTIEALHALPQHGRHNFQNHERFRSFTSKRRRLNLSDDDDSDMVDEDHADSDYEASADEADPTTVNSARKLQHQINKMVKEWKSTEGKLESAIPLPFDEYNAMSHPDDADLDESILVHHRTEMKKAFYSSSPTLEQLQEDQVETKQPDGVEGPEGEEKSSGDASTGGSRTKATTFTHPTRPEETGVLKDTQRDETTRNISPGLDRDEGDDASYLEVNMAVQSGSATINDTRELDSDDMAIQLSRNKRVLVANADDISYFNVILRSQDDSISVVGYTQVDQQNIPTGYLQPPTRQKPGSSTEAEEAEDTSVYISFTMNQDTNSLQVILTPHDHDPDQEQGRTAMDKQVDGGKEEVNQPPTDLQHPVRPKNRPYGLHEADMMDDFDGSMRVTNAGASSATTMERNRRVNSQIIHREVMELYLRHRNDLSFSEPQSLGLYGTDLDIYRVLTYLHYQGLDHNMLMRVINKTPQFFTLKLETEIIPKVQYLLSLGIKQKELQTLFVSDAWIFSFNMDTLKQKLNYVIQSGLFKKNSSRLLRLPRWLLGSIEHTLAPHIDCLKIYLDLTPETFNSLVSSAPQLLLPFPRENLIRLSWYHSIYRGLPLTRLRGVVERIPSILKRDPMEQMQEQHFLFKSFWPHLDFYQDFLVREPMTLYISQAEIERKIKFFCFLGFPYDLALHTISRSPKLLTTRLIKLYHKIHLMQYELGLKLPDLSPFLAKYDSHHVDQYRTFPGLSNIDQLVDPNQRLAAPMTGTQLHIPPGANYTGRRSHQRPTIQYGAALKAYPTLQGLLLPPAVPTVVEKPGFTDPRVYRACQLANLHLFSSIQLNTAPEAQQAYLPSKLRSANTPDSLDSTTGDADDPDSSSDPHLVPFTPVNVLFHVTSPNLKRNLRRLERISPLAAGQFEQLTFHNQAIKQSFPPTKEQMDYIQHKVPIEFDLQSPTAYANALKSLPVLYKHNPHEPMTSHNFHTAKLPFTRGVMFSELFPHEFTVIQERFHTLHTKIIEHLGDVSMDEFMQRPEYQSAINALQSKVEQEFGINISQFSFDEDFSLNDRPASLHEISTFYQSYHQQYANFETRKLIFFPTGGRYYEKVCSLEHPVLVEALNQYGIPLDRIYQQPQIPNFYQQKTSDTHSLWPFPLYDSKGERVWLNCYDAKGTSTALKAKQEYITLKPAVELEADSLLGKRVSSDSSKRFHDFDHSTHINYIRQVVDFSNDPFEYVPDPALTSLYVNAKDPSIPCPRPLYFRSVAEAMYIIGVSHFSPSRALTNIQRNIALIYTFMNGLIELDYKLYQHGLIPPPDLYQLFSSMFHHHYLPSPADFLNTKRKSSIRFTNNMVNSINRAYAIAGIRLYVNQQGFTPTTTLSALTQRKRVKGTQDIQKTSQDWLQNNLHTMQQLIGTKMVSRLQSMTNENLSKGMNFLTRYRALFDVYSPEETANLNATLGPGATNPPLNRQRGTSPEPQTSKRSKLPLFSTQHQRQAFDPLSQYALPTPIAPFIHRHDDIMAFRQHYFNSLSPSFYTKSYDLYHHRYFHFHFSQRRFILSYYTLAMRLLSRSDLNNRELFYTNYQSNLSPIANVLATGSGQPAASDLWAGDTELLKSSVDQNLTRLMSNELSYSTSLVNQSSGGLSTTPASTGSNDDDDHTHSSSILRNGVVPNTLVPPPLRDIIALQHIEPLMLTHDDYDRPLSRSPFIGDDVIDIYRRRQDELETIAYSFGWKVTPRKRLSQPTVTKSSSSSTSGLLMKNNQQDKEGRRTNENSGELHWFVTLSSDGKPFKQYYTLIDLPEGELSGVNTADAEAPSTEAPEIPLEKPTGKKRGRKPGKGRHLHASQQNVFDSIIALKDNDAPAQGKKAKQTKSTKKSLTSHVKPPQDTNKDRFERLMNFKRQRSDLEVLHNHYAEDYKIRRHAPVQFLRIFTFSSIASTFPRFSVLKELHELSKESPVAVNFQALAQSPLPPDHIENINHDSMAYVDQYPIEAYDQTYDYLASPNSSDGSSKHRSSAKKSELTKMLSGLTDIHERHDHVDVLEEYMLNKMPKSSHILRSHHGIIPSALLQKITELAKHTVRVSTPISVESIPADQDGYGQSHDANIPTESQVAYRHWLDDNKAAGSTKKRRRRGSILKQVPKSQINSWSRLDAEKMPNHLILASGTDDSISMSQDGNRPYTRRISKLMKTDEYRKSHLVVHGTLLDIGYQHANRLPQNVTTSHAMSVTGNSSIVATGSTGGGPQATTATSDFASPHMKYSNRTTFLQIPPAARSLFALPDYIKSRIEHEQHQYDIYKELSMHMKLPNAQIIPYLAKYLSASKMQLYALSFYDHLLPRLSRALLSYQRRVDNVISHARAIQVARSQVANIQLSNAMIDYSLKFKESCQTENDVAKKMHDELQALSDQFVDRSTKYVSLIGETSTRITWGGGDKDGEANDGFEDYHSALTPEPSLSEAILTTSGTAGEEVQASKPADDGVRNPPPSHGSRVASTDTTPVKLQPPSLQESFALRPSLDDISDQSSSSLPEVSLRKYRLNSSELQNTYLEAYMLSPSPVPRQWSPSLRRQIKRGARGEDIDDFDMLAASVSSNTSQRSGSDAQYHQMSEDHENSKSSSLEAEGEDTQDSSPQRLSPGTTPSSNSSSQLPSPMATSTTSKDEDYDVLVSANSPYAMFKHQRTFLEQRPQVTEFTPKQFIVNLSANHYAETNAIFLSNLIALRYSLPIVKLSLSNPVQLTNLQVIQQHYNMIFHNLRLITVPELQAVIREYQVRNPHHEVHVSSDYKTLDIIDNFRQYIDSQYMDQGTAGRHSGHQHADFAKGNEIIPVFNSTTPDSDFYEIPDAYDDDHLTLGMKKQFQTPGGTANQESKGLPQSVPASLRHEKYPPRSTTHHLDQSGQSHIKLHPSIALRGQEQGWDSALEKRDTAQDFIDVSVIDATDAEYHDIVHDDYDIHRGESDHDSHQTNHRQFKEDTHDVHADSQSDISEHNQISEETSNTSRHNIQKSPDLPTLLAQDVLLTRIAQDPFLPTLDRYQQQQHIYHTFLSYSEYKAQKGKKFDAPPLALIRAVASTITITDPSQEFSLYFPSKLRGTSVHDLYSSEMLQSLPKSHPFHHTSSSDSPSPSQDNVSIPQLLVSDGSFSHQVLPQTRVIHDLVGVLRPSSTLDCTSPMSNRFEFDSMLKQRRSRVVAGFSPPSSLTMAGQTYLETVLSNHTYLKETIEQLNQRNALYNSYAQDQHIQTGVPQSPNVQVEMGPVFLENGFLCVEVQHFPISAAFRQYPREGESVSQRSTFDLQLQSYAELPLDIYTLFTHSPLYDAPSDGHRLDSTIHPILIQPQRTLVYLHNLSVVCFFGDTSSSKRPLPNAFIPSHSTSTERQYGLQALQFVQNKIDAFFAQRLDSISSLDLFSNLLNSFIRSTPLDQRYVTTRFLHTLFYYVQTKFDEMAYLRPFLVGLPNDYGVVSDISSRNPRRIDNSLRFMIDQLFKHDDDDITRQYLAHTQKNALVARPVARHAHSLALYDYDEAALTQERKDKSPPFADIQKMAFEATPQRFSSLRFLAPSKSDVNIPSSFFNVPSLVRFGTVEPPVKFQSPPTPYNVGLQETSDPSQLAFLPTPVESISYQSHSGEAVNVKELYHSYDQQKTTRQELFDRAVKNPSINTHLLSPEDRDDHLFMTSSSYKSNLHNASYLNYFRSIHNSSQRHLYPSDTFPYQSDQPSEHHPYVLYPNSISPIDFALDPLECAELLRVHNLSCRGLLLDWSYSLHKFQDRIQTTSVNELQLLKLQNDMLEIVDLVINKQLTTPVLDHRDANTYCALPLTPPSSRFNKADVAAFDLLLEKKLKF